MEKTNAIRGRQNIVIVPTIARQSEGAPPAACAENAPPYFLDDFRYY
ncbi:hypothetical protein [uncultured Akkermansia sp.]|nr:hypothetical protein [uncultured Akkermansia sp.]